MSVRLPLGLYERVCFFGCVCVYIKFNFINLIIKYYFLSFLSFIICVYLCTRYYQCTTIASNRGIINYYQFGIIFFAEQLYIIPS